MIKLQLRYYEDRGTYKEIIRNDKSMFKCPYCGEWFKALAYHTRQKHGIKAKELRKNLGLKSDYQLITPALRERHREIVMENKDSHITNNLIIKGKKTRYKDGFEGHIKKNWSNQAIKEMSKRGKKTIKNTMKVKNDK